MVKRPSSRIADQNSNRCRPRFLPVIRRVQKAGRATHVVHSAVGTMAQVYKVLMG